MTSPVRVLKIIPYPLFPAWSGGKIRTVQLSRNLASLGADVTVLTPWHPNQQRSLHATEPFRVRSIAYPYLLPLLFTDRPFPFQYLMSWHPGLGALLRGQLAGYDIYQIEHVAWAGLLDLVPRNACVVDGSHNVEFDYVGQECPTPWIRKVVSRRIFGLEGRLIRRSRHTLAVSKKDAARLVQLYGVDSGSISVLPQGIPDIHPPVPPRPSHAVFSGSDVEHNRRAVRFILADLAPRCPQMRFVIHGSCGDRFRANIPGNVSFDREFSRFEAHAGCWGLNPTLTGSGANLKLLHYLRYRMPVLTTAFGIRGFEELARHTVISEPQDWHEVLSSHRLPEPPPVSLLAPYLWRRLAARMLAVYESLLPALPCD